MFRRNARAAGGRHIEELSVAAIPEKLSRLFELFSQVVLFYEWVHVAAGDKQVRPTVIVKVQEGGAPLNILRVHGQPCGTGNIIECATVAVAIERVGVVGKIGLENVQPAI